MLPHAAVTSVKLVTLDDILPHRTKVRLQQRGGAAASTNSNSSLASSGGAAHLHLSRDATEKLLQRLHKPLPAVRASPTWAAEEKKILRPSRKVPEGALQDSTDRVYRQAILARESSAQQRAAKYLDALHPARTMDRDKETALIDRMYDRPLQAHKSAMAAREAKQVALEKSKHAYVRIARAAATSPPPPFVERLNSASSREEKMAKLHTTYVTSKSPPRIQRSPGEIAASVKRLAAGSP